MNPSSRNRDAIHARLVAAASCMELSLVTSLEEIAFLPRDATQSPVMPQYIVRLSVRLSVRLRRSGTVITWVGILRK